MVPEPTPPMNPGDDLARGLADLLLDVAVRLINMPVDELNDALDEMLAAVGNHTAVDRVTVIRYDWAAGTASATHEWCAAGIAPAIDELQLLPFGALWPEFAHDHRTGKQIYIPDVLTMPPSPFRDLLVKGGTRSLLDTPLIDAGHCLGVVSMETVGRPARWSQPHRDVLRILARLLINIEHRRRHDHTVGQLRRANEINTELERFAGVVAHDLQSPLTSSLGLLSLVRSGRIPAEQQDEFLARTESGLRRMSALIQRLLRYASAGRMLGSLQPVRLDDVVDESVEACRQLIADRDARIHRTSLPSVLGDPTRLAEVVTNLITNAIRHIPPPQIPRIWVSGSETDHTVELTVADNGPGIRAEDRMRVLAPFELLDGASADPGTGLGLPIVVGIIEAHGGQLELSTSDAGGLLVRMQLPRTEAPRPEHQGHPAAAHGVAG